MPTKKISGNPDSNGFVRLILVKPFAEEASNRGADVGAVVGSFGLTMADLKDPSRFVHAETIYKVVDQLAEQANDPHLGYHVGSKLDFAIWPPFQRAVNEARTVGEFLTAYLSAVPSEANSVRHELSITAEGACYRVKRLVQAKTSLQHTEAFGAAIFIRLFQSITGNAWKPAHMTVKTLYAEALPKCVHGVVVEHKNEAGLETHFPSCWLYEPLQLNSQLRNKTILKPEGNRDVTLLNVFRNTAASMLQDLGSGAQEVAQAIGVAAATLEAALKKEGTSAAKEFRRLRVETAQRRLTGGTDKVSTIATDLGYSDPAHFTRFFRNQTGLSPTEYRSQNSSK